MNSNQVLTVRIPKENWNEYTSSKEYVSTRNTPSRQSRKTLLAAFSHRLSERLQTLGINYLEYKHII